jgi:hypothetical protein
MIATTSDLTSFAESLESVLAAGNAASFEEYLRGRHLPALGGDATPAEILGGALDQLSDFSTSALRVSQILARILGEEASGFRQEHLGPRRRAVLLGALQLAFSLPAEPGLATALRDLLAALRSCEEGELGDEPFTIWFALWRALARQQNDASLESEWMSLLAISSEEWTPERRTLLLEAWRGLLRIPPDAAAQQVGEVIDFERVERGLLRLQDTLQNCQGWAPILRYAFEFLMATFPRSNDFWITRWEKRVLSWPEDLRTEACRLLPALMESAAQWCYTQQRMLDELHRIQVAGLGGYAVRR